MPAVRHRLFDHLRERRTARAERAQTLDDPAPIGLAPVLTQLPLAFAARDREFDADDRAHLRGDEVVRRIRDLPWSRHRFLVEVRQILELTAQPVRLVDQPRLTPDVHGHEVPRRDHLAGFALRRVPAR